MAKRFSEEPGFFGSVAIGNPKSSFAERTFVASVDFSRKAVAENTKVGIMELPAGFLIDRITVVQTKPFATALTDSTAVKFGPNSDATVFFGDKFKFGATSAAFVRTTSAPVATATSATVTGGTAGETVSVNIPGSYFVNAADLLCMDVPDGQTGDKIAEGAFEIAVHGYEVAFEKGDGFDGNSLGRKTFRASLQTPEQENANVSGGQYPID